MISKSRTSNRIVDLMMFFGILLSGADIYSFDINGLTIRYIQIIYLALGLFFLIFKKYYFKNIKIFLPFLMFYCISTFFSINVINSIFYLFWLLYNVFFVTYLVVTYTKIYGSKKTKNLFEIAFISISILTIIQFLYMNVFKTEIIFFRNQLHKGIWRPALWFYEPSYLATFLSFSFAYFVNRFFLYDSKKYLFPSIVTLISLISTTSTTAFICIFIVILLNIILYIKKIGFLNLKFRNVLFLFSFCAIGLLLVVVFLPNIFETFVLRLFESGIVASSGDRIDRWSEAITIFSKFPIFGIGPNNYGYYFGIPYKEATNITLELLATTGIFSTIAFYIIPVYLIILTIKTNKSELFVSLLTIIIILQANQNYLRIYLWLFYGFIIALLYYDKDKNPIELLQNNNSDTISIKHFT